MSGFYRSLSSARRTFMRWRDTVRQSLGKPSFKEASKEVAITVGTATLPIWFFPLMGLILFNPRTSGDLLEHSVANGELFLFSTSLVGPLIYILFRVYDPKERPFNAKKTSLVFPNSLLFAVIIFLICITSAAVFGLQKINPDFSASKISKPGYIILSGIIFVVSVLSLLVATKSRNELVDESPTQQMREEEDEFAIKFSSGETS
ncbi:MAG: hypothetical protein HY242_03365 [Afipia sp.]|nr:hypothetical protein [Afipia sp.]